MSDFPVPLDNLIAYVRTLHPAGGPLGRLSGAMAVSAELDEQSDALIGYFVDQARRSGASWSQIGASMGVSKQAAQKRFVARDAAGLAPEGQAEFSRFTQRARNVLASAGQLAAPEPIGAGHLTAGLLAEPDGIAAKVLARAGLTTDQVVAGAAAGPAAPAGDADAAALQELSFSPDGTAVLRGALKAALRLGHNYIGTEHVLLGILAADSPAARALASRGLTAEAGREFIAAEFARVQAQRGTG